MEPAAIPEPAGFSDLSKAEQIRYLQALWDRDAEGTGTIASPSHPPSPPSVPYATPVGATRRPW